MSRKKTNRRNFIKNSSLALMFAPVLGKSTLLPDQDTKEPEEILKIKNYNTLGRTGFKVSDIASGSPRSEAVLRALLKSGVNSIDTGEDYGNGNNERLIGRVLPEFDRKKIFIMSKLYTDTNFESKEKVVEKIRGALERLGTDYIDCVGIHSAENTRIIKDEAFHAGVEQMKAEGRVKYTGVSCHGNSWYMAPEESLDKVLMAAVDDGRFDVIQMAYNFVNAPMADKILAACEEKNIGTIIIKSNPVVIYNILDKYVKNLENQEKDPGEGYYAYRDRYKERAEKAKSYFNKYGKTTEEELIDAATLFVLSNPQAHTVCIDIPNLTSINPYLKLSGKTLQPVQASLLENYMEYFGTLNCRIGCNECEKACPHHLPVNTIMRYNYYFQNKKLEKEAMQLYAKIPGKNADVCKDCQGYCEEACPYDVSTHNLLSIAHQNLSLDQVSFG